MARQDDFMKRIRSNGGARTALAPEGYLIPGGDYDQHRRIARELGATVPEPGEVVSLRVVPATSGDSASTLLEGQEWRLAQPGEAATQRAPALPKIRLADNP